MIYYLSFGKYLKQIPKPGRKLHSFLSNTGNLNQEVNANTNEPELCLDTFDILGLSLKRSCSITLEKESSLKKNRADKNLTQNNFISNSQIISNNDFNFRIFSKHLPEWGGKIVLRELDFFKDSPYYDTCSLYENLEIINTCSIDYFLLALWCSNKLSSKIKTILKAYTD